MLWGQANESVPIQISGPIRVAIFVCIAGMFWLGVFPGVLLDMAKDSASVLGY